jgi:hypothetical protein
METVRVIYHHEADSWWAESPDVEGWALEHDAVLEHYVPAGTRIPA